MMVFSFLIRLYERERSSVNAFLCWFISAMSVLALPRPATRVRQPQAQQMSYSLVAAAAYVMWLGRRGLEYHENEDMTPHFYVEFKNTMFLNTSFLLFARSIPKSTVFIHPFSRIFHFFSYIYVNVFQFFKNF